MLRLPVIIVVAGLVAGPGTVVPGAPDVRGSLVERARYLMGTVCKAAAYPSEEAGASTVQEVAGALEAAFDEIARLEAVLSDWRSDSELSRLNREAAAAPFPCSHDLFDFISSAIEYHRATDGAFDTAVAPLVELWDLRGEGRIPASSEIEKALGTADSSLLVLEPSQRSIRFEVPGMGLDPGALGKGYALDAAARVLRAHGIRSAMLDFGGQVLALGSPPGTDGWEIAVAHPLRRDEPILTLEIRDASVATSGNSEKRFVVDGRPLGHVLDPRTGVPLATGGSVSVIAPTGSDADAFSTALLVMGPDEGLEWVSHRKNLSAVYLDVNGSGELRVRATPGLELEGLAGRGLQGVSWRWR